MTATLINNINWGESYPQLHAQARRLVHKYQLANWRGQEEDLAWDIVQESVRKVFEYTQIDNKHEPKAVQSLKGLLATTVRNYSTDLYRREKRLVRETSGLAAREFSDDEASFSEVATENVYRERLFRFLAREIVRFPPKQRQALLVDLASRMVFEEQPTALQAAFLAEGIHLEEYQQSRPQTALERNRNAALLNHAYKRLRELEEVELYLA